MHLTYYIYTLRTLVDHLALTPTPSFLSILIFNWFNFVNFNFQWNQSKRHKYSIAETSSFDLWTFDPKISRGPSWVMVNTCVKYHHCMPKRNGVIVRKRLKLLSSNMTLTFDLLTQNQKRSFSVHCQYMCEVSSFFHKELDLSCRNLKHLKVQYETGLWPFDPKINRGHSKVMVNTCVKYHHCRAKAKGNIVQKPLFSRRKDKTDRQTAIHGETSIPQQLRWLIYRILNNGHRL